MAKIQAEAKEKRKTDEIQMAQFNAEIAKIGASIARDKAKTNADKELALIELELPIGVTETTNDYNKLKNALLTRYNIFMKLATVGVKPEMSRLRI